MKTHAIQLLLLAMTLSLFRSEALADPVSCSITIPSGFFHKNHVYTATDPLPASGPDIGKARAQVIAACKAGENDSGCENTLNRLGGFPFKCVTAGKEIQFHCGAHAADNEDLRAYGTDYTAAGALESAKASCENGEETGQCVENPESCEEKLVVPAKAEWWKLRSSILPDHVESNAESNRDAKNLPPEEIPTQVEGSRANSAVGL